MAELKRIIGGREGQVEVIVGENRVLFRLEGVELVASLLQLQFPEVERIIPTAHSTRTIASTGELAKAFRSALVFARDSGNVARLRIVPGAGATPGYVSIAARSDEAGSNASQVDAEVEGDEIEIGLNANYLIDVLSTLDAPAVSIETTAPGSPAVLRPAGGEGEGDCLHVIMPMSLG